jgi:hypothetical protein
MAFVVNDRGHSILTRKEKIGGHWKNKRIANLFEHVSVGDALKNLPCDIADLESAIAECRKSIIGSTDRRSRTWVLAEIRHLEKQHRLRVENYIKIIEFADKTATGTFSGGDGI